MGGELSDFGSGIGGAGLVDEEEDETVDLGENEWGLATANLAIILAEGDIAAVVEDVFDMPMLTDEAQDLGWGGSIGMETGEAVDTFATGKATAVNGAFDLKDLGHIGPTGFEVVREGSADTEGAVFKAAVAFIESGRRALGQVREGASFEQAGDILIQLPAVGFGDEQIVAARLADLAAPSRSGMQSISTDDKTTQIR